MWYGARMSYTEFMLWKLGALVLAAFIWGFLCEWTGRELNGQKKEDR